MKTLYHYLADYAQSAPQKRLLGDRCGWLTVQQTLDRVNTLAGQLAGQGIGPGTWVALRMTQERRSVLFLLALEALGAVAVLTDAHTGVSQALAKADMATLPALALTSEGGSWCLITPDGALAVDGLEARPFSLWPDPLGPGYVIFTSGSTGKQKGVILSQNNVIANLLDTAPLGGYTPDDIALGALPLCHVFGLAMITGAIVLGHSLFVTPGGNLDGMLAVIQEQRITRMNGVPSLYLTMAAQKDRFDLSSLRVGLIGGGPCTPEQFDTIERALSMTLIPVYGMSESIGISCASYRDPAAARREGVGPFYPRNTSRILTPSGREAPPGEVGEICVKGPMRFLGYCRQDQTEAAIDREGFLHTGDLGYLDEAGILHLTGRKKDIIIRNGVNLSPRQIEEALLAIPGVRQALVVGLPHPVQGEVPYAMVVSQRTESEILTHLARILPKNQIPLGIYPVASLPLTLSGKPDKIKIREVLAQWAKA